MVKKLFFGFTVLLFSTVAFFYTNIIPRHGSIKNWIDIQLYSPVFDLSHTENCYELQPNNVLIMKDSGSTNALDPKAPAEGSIMYVAKTDFNPEEYFYECHHFSGYLTYKYGGIGVWYLTDVL